MKKLCHCTFRQQQTKSNSHKLMQAIAFVVPSALLVLIPKCPMCLAAYLAIMTGIELSVSGASHLQLALTTICLGTICLTIVAHLIQFQRKILQHKTGE